ncbi:hypothetical protein LOC68_01725 [Blastopirellula sp. JC732]|uniref:Uncharacterized protein n=1 Tax=Blastopirellula sediminis TaxID=2894196 RepID=A0A9X1MHL7_9BACT|nr:hypothetical protein [Blastopirellula sediminis]MCC9608093.1 hypothetical protein [Blastopirellula sediminis]MCC9627114.1 hypothetical protein [Blastopirellula sediminis]
MAADQESQTAQSTDTIVVWGNTNVGKTTLLATALYHESTKSSLNKYIDFRESMTRERGYPSVFSHHWGTISKSRPTQSTSGFVDCELVLENGQGVVTLIDGYGGRMLEDNTPHVRNRIIEARGVLFIVPWTREMEQDFDDFAAISKYWHSLDHSTQRVGIVFTKCEQYLDVKDPAWNFAPGWWRDRPLPMARELPMILESAGPAVWPTSVFGFDEIGQPNCILDEFGQLVPLHIKPRNVSQPLEWMLEGLTNAY